jgi:hypothetical protein
MLWRMHGAFVMTKEAATQIRDLAIKAIANLSALLKGAEGNCSAKEFEKLRRSVANMIALIDKDILWAIYSQYPDLDDLK